MLHLDAPKAVFHSTLCQTLISLPEALKVLKGPILLYLCILQGHLCCGFGPVTGMEMDV